MKEINDTNKLKIIIISEVKGLQEQLILQPPLQKPISTVAINAEKIPVRVSERLIPNLLSFDSK